MVKGISKLVMNLTVRLTCVKGKVKSDSRFDLSFAKDQMCNKSNFLSRGSVLFKLKLLIVGADLNSRLILDQRSGPKCLRVCLYFFG